MPTITKRVVPKQNVPLDRYKLLRIIQAMADGVLVFNPQGIVLLCNPAFEKIFGIHQEDIIGQPLRLLFELEAPELPDVLTLLLESGEAFSQEVVLHQGRQKRTFRLDTLPIEEDGVVSEGVAVFHDITKVKQTEKMRRDFVANVSHELRTPLSAIHGYAETLLEGALEDAEVSKDFVQIIFNHSKRLSQLVQDLLDLSKLESEECPFELHPTPLIPLIEKVVQLAQKQLSEKQIQLTFQPPLSFPYVVAHDSNIEQVLTNLLDNAIKYTPEKGTITIQTAISNAMVQVDVQDTGIGIEPKHIPRLFERFYRVDKARSRDMGGTGLGLSIVKHIIQYHGGDVWVTSTPAKGSTFSFTLQIAS